jgi:hypothetical protein
MFAVVKEDGSFQTAVAPGRYVLSVILGPGDTYVSSISYGRSRGPWTSYRFLPRQPGRNRNPCCERRGQSGWCRCRAFTSG